MRALARSPRASLAARRAASRPPRRGTAAGAEPLRRQLQPLPRRRPDTGLPGHGPVAARRGGARRRLLPPHRLHAARRPARAADALARPLRRARRSGRSSRTSRRSATGPRDPDAAPEPRQRRRRACGSSPTTAPAATRSPPRAATSPARACRRSHEATDRQIAEAVRIGPYLMPRFSRRQRSPTRSSTRLVAYVDYAKHPDDRGGWSIGRLGPWPEGIVTWLSPPPRSSRRVSLIGRRLKHVSRMKNAVVAGVVLLLGPAASHRAPAPSTGSCPPGPPDAPLPRLLLLACSA